MFVAAMLEVTGKYDVEIPIVAWISKQ